MSDQQTTAAVYRSECCCGRTVCVKRETPRYSRPADGSWIRCAECKSIVRGQLTDLDELEEVDLR